MQDPVTTADGHSYEREHRGVVREALGAALTSPVTGLRLPSRALVDNITLRKSMGTPHSRKSSTARGRTAVTDPAPGPAAAARAAPRPARRRRGWNIPGRGWSSEISSTRGRSGSAPRVRDDGRRSQSQ